MLWSELFQEPDVFETCQYITESTSVIFHANRENRNLFWSIITTSLTVLPALGFLPIGIIYLPNSDR